MRITKIIVTKLFGIFDHEIPLNLDDRITIIHAPNGFGKTIILNMINGLFNGNYSIFFSVPFERFEVEFDDNTNVWIEKKKDDSPIQISLFDELENFEIKRNSEKIPSEITFNLLGAGDDKPESFAYSYKSIEKSSEIDLRKLIDTKIPDLERIGPGQWMYSTGEVLSIYDVLDRFGHYLNEEYKLPEWLMDLQNEIYIRFIQTQRLQNFIIDLNPSIPSYRRRSVPISTVVEYAKDLREEIQKKLAESASLSQSLDRTFPERLIRQIGKNHSKLKIEVLTSRLRELERTRTRLIAAGLLDAETVSDFRIPEKTSQDTKEVLTVYVEDVEKKLGIFDDLAEKINLFKEMINKRFSYKEMLVSKDKGFYFITADGKTLPLRALSSGEQHELVLLYQLLFKTEPNTVILIDEPEISLHVAWQIEFLKDLQKIVDLAELDVILATHSPQIINDRWDLTVELESPVSSYEAISHTR